MRRRGLQASEHRILLLLGDLLVTTAGILFGLWVWSITAGEALSGAFVVERAYWFLAVPIWLIALVPAYDFRVALSVEETAWALIRAVVFLLVLYLAVYFYSPREVLPRLMAVYALWEAALLTFGWLLSYISVSTETAFRRRILIFGAGAAGRTVARLMREAGMRHAIVEGFIDEDSTERETTVEGLSVLSDHNGMSQIVRERQVSEIILATTHDIGHRALHALIQCQERGVELVRMASVYEDTLKRVPVEHLDTDWLITSFIDAVRAKDASRIVKRVLDVLGSLVAIALLLFVGPVIAIAVWLETGRPIFYRQVRLGRNGAQFTLLKFRSMISDAEGDGRPRQAVPNDRRATAVGRWLRRTRLDELPQAINVLRGEMSLVGPRPERPEFVALLEQQIPFYRTRLLVRPGVTGWAQVNLTAIESVAHPLTKLEYDLYYIKHRSIVFDFWIILLDRKSVV